MHPSTPRAALAAFAFFGTLIAAVSAFAAKCGLARMAEFPITMQNLRPLMSAKVNGVDVQFIVDSGASYSTLSGASASQLDLKTYQAPFGIYLKGVGGGTADVAVTKVKVFTLAGTPVPNVEFLVGGTDMGSDSIGVLGQNVLHLADVEYDLGEGFVRLMKPIGCSAKTMLAYWAADTSMPYSEITIEPTTARSPDTLSSAFINGTEIKVVFDTGSRTSILSLKAAARVGIKPGSEGVVREGTSYGIGKSALVTYIAPFSSFKIGEEEIRNTRLRIGDIDLPNADMLIGADFFLSHRIYVANGQHKLYFTYNGGPVFDLAGAKHPSAEPVTDSPTEDAADYSRRGSALASRRDFEAALTDLTRACELAPDHPEYFYQRGMVHRQLKQPTEAMADFDRSLKLKPDEVMALVARAELELQGGDKLRGAADLDAADKTAPKESNIRLTLGETYESIDLLERAMVQYTLWMASHEDDPRLPHALNHRCWIRAVQGVDLPLALKDCNAAAKGAEKPSPFYAAVLDSRGLVLLRMGDYDKSIADYDASLKIRPAPWSLYGRGIAELREHKTSAGEADIARATGLSPKIADEFNRRGITP